MRRGGSRRKKRGEPLAPPPPREEVYELAARVAARFDCEIVERSYSPRGSVRIVVDREPQPVDTDLLVDLIRAFRAELAAAGRDPGTLRIEFESPGSRRLLTTARHFERFRGRRVTVRFADPEREGRPQGVFLLEGTENGLPVVRDEEGRRLVLPRSRYASIRLRPDPPA